MAGPITISKSKGFSLRIRGYSETLRNIQRTRNLQGEGLQRFLKQEGEKVVKTAKSIVPVDTGRLKDSHRVLTYGAAERHFVRVDVVAGGIIIRGRFVNYAAAVHRDRPWLMAALRMHEPGYKSRLKKYVKVYGKR